MPALLVLAALLAGCAIPAILPSIADIPPAEPQAIDGIWRLEEYKARIRIEAGRVWAYEPYVVIAVAIAKDQVTVRDLHQTGPRTWVGHDMGANGPFEAVLNDAGKLDMTVTPLIGFPLKITAERVELDYPGWLAAQAASEQIVAAPAGLGAAVADTRRPGPAPGRLAPAPQPAALPLQGLTPGSFGRYHALVIGNDSYRGLPSLRTARRDARAVGALLRERYGFRVRELLDATREDILVALGDLRRDLGPDDNLLIYYAGHGWLDPEADEGYWLPIDASQDSNVHWISNASITSSLKALRARQLLVVADSCYSGKLTRGLQMSTRAQRSITHVAQKRSRLVISSGGLEPVLDSGGGDHSVFAAAFLDALRDNPGLLDATTLFAGIRRRVLVNADQTPELADIRKAGHEGGDFFFLPVAE